MLERIWIHIQTYTIIVLVNSPALLMLWTGFQSTEIIHHGPQSTATQEAPVEIYSVYIEPEEEKSVEQPQKEEQTITKKPVVKVQKEKKTTSKPTSVSKETPKRDVKTSKNLSIPKKPLSITKKPLSITKKSIKERKLAQRKKYKRASARCTPSPNRRIQQISNHQFVVKRKALNRYLGNLDNIKGLAKAYWYKGKRVEGILLKSIPCKSPLRNMGILPNDIIVSINGKKVENNLALIGHYFNLRSKKNVDIILKRQNRPITLQYEIVKKLKKG